MYSDQGYSLVFVDWTKKNVFKRDLNDDSDGAHLTSFEIEFQTEEEAKENERSPSVDLLCAGASVAGVQWLSMQHVSDIWLCSIAVAVVAKQAILQVLLTLTGRILSAWAY